VFDHYCQNRGRHNANRFSSAMSKFAISWTHDAISGRLWPKKSRLCMLRQVFEDLERWCSDHHHQVEPLYDELQAKRLKKLQQAAEASQGVRDMAAEMLKKSEQSAGRTQSLQRFLAALSSGTSVIPNHALPSNLLAALSRASSTITRFQHYHALPALSRASSTITRFRTITRFQHYHALPTLSRASSAQADARW
jgi:hypothetical protein